MNAREQLSVWDGVTSNPVRFLGGGVLVDGGAEWHVVYRFTSEGAAQWKMWFVNMRAVFPPVLLFNLTVLPHLGDLNALIRTLLLCLCVTALVTWIPMSRLQRFFRRPANEQREVGG
ncbi:hypothetical protein [Streptomyces caelestis]|uniref:Antibiotic biosynthesis monooxygenase (ABM) superfamily enzyme n=1 Tax=Streptomyces caelestis TaxID=36816 RepID=A0A7W9H7I9_9ACTN|nr:antibiotic biosynthesis monooxygenase (ABM) superfamily enzyme [Streptomyces caelestis]GGW35599.1 hypothetical protein GCM10010320_13620 [Streptomyces caelestis]